MKKLWILLLVAAVGLAGFGYVARDQIPALAGSAEAASAGDEAATEIAPVLPPVLAGDQVIVEARVAPVREAELSMSGSGLVAQILVAEGESLAAGSPVLRLHGQRQAAALAQAQANLRNAQLQLAELTAEPRSAEIARYQASIDLARANLQKVLDGATQADVVAARSNLRSTEASLRKAQAEYDQVSWRNDIGMLPQATALEQANNDYVAAQAQLDELLAGPKAADIARARAEVRVAEADLEIFLDGATSESIAAAEAQVAAAQAVVLDAQAALEDLVLRTPFAGTIAALNVEVGEQVSPGQIVAHLADLSAWRIETADLTELSVVNVQAGDRVEILVDALPDAELAGRVTRVKPIGENVQGDIIYTGLIDLDRQDGRLRWNMTAQTTIIPDEAGRAEARMAGTRSGIEAAAEPMMPETTALGDVDDILAQVADILADTEPVAAAPAPEEEAGPVLATVRTGGANLNLRSGPSVDSPVVGQAAVGATVSVLGRNSDGSWLQIQAEGQEVAWAAADFIELAADTALAQVPVAVNAG